MPNLKRNAANAPDSTGFESYDGPNPPMQQRMYRGKIEVARVREASTGTIGFNVLVKFEAEKGDKDNAKYNGYPAWCDIWLSDKEPNMAREKAFYRAVGVPEAKLEDVSVVHDEIDDGGAIKKIAGRNPVGRVVKIDMRTDRYDGETRLKGDAIYPAKDSGKESVAEEPEEELDDDEDLLDDAEEIDPDEREEELRALSLPALRKLAQSDYDIDTKGLKKDDLVEAILDHEAEDVEDDETGEEEEEPEEDDEDGLLSYEDALAMTLPKLKKMAIEEGEYEREDLKGLSKEEVVDLLVDVELVASNEPPF